MILTNLLLLKWICWTETNFGKKIKKTRSRRSRILSKKMVLKSVRSLLSLLQSKYTETGRQLWLMVWTSMWIEWTRRDKIKNYRSKSKIQKWEVETIGQGEQLYLNSLNLQLKGIDQSQQQQLFNDHQILHERWIQPQSLPKRKLKKIQLLTTDLWKHHKKKMRNTILINKTVWCFFASKFKIWTLIFNY